MVPSERPTRLAIIGASVRAAAQSALRAGFEVVGADLFADADLDGVCPITKIEDYPHGFADWLAKQEVDAWMYTGALENYPDLVDQMAAIKPLWGVSGEALRRCRDPRSYDPGVCRGQLYLPETIDADGTIDSEREWLAKTYRHSAGVGVWRVESDADLQRAQAERAVLQEKIDGAPISAIFALGPRHPNLLGVTQQLFGGRDAEFAYRGSIGPLPTAERLESLLGIVGVWLLSVMKLSGVVGVDLVVQDNRPFVVEINPRFSASIEVLERSVADAAVAAHAACFTAPSSYDWNREIRKPVGKYILYAAQAIQIGETLAAELLEGCRSGRVADVPRAGTEIGAGEPICTILVEGVSCSAVAEGLDAFSRDLLNRLAARG